MIEVFGDLRIAGPHGEALVTARGGSVAVRSAKSFRGVGFLRSIGWRRLQHLAGRLDRAGLTVSVETPFLFALTLGRDAEPGFLLRSLGCRHLALRRATPAVR